MHLILETDAVKEMAIVRILGSPQMIGLGQSLNFLNKIIVKIGRMPQHLRNILRNLGDTFDPN